MPARTTTRLGAARGLAQAVRTATRPGSASIGERLAALPRLAAAVRDGRYRGASLGQLAAVGLGLAYVVSPVDVLPEALLGLFGLGDDAVVIALAGSALVNLTEDFLSWERTAQAPADTVRGHVVR